MPSPRRTGTRRGLQRQCVSCKSHFTPHHRLGFRQKTCGQVPCRRQHRADYRRKYRKKNPEAEQEYTQKRKENRPSDFWKQFRKAHPAYVNRNLAQARLRKKLYSVGLQRQLDIVQLFDPPEKFDLLVEFATSHRSLLEDCQVSHAA